MYKVKCTGKNLCYGEKDEIRLVADHFIRPGVLQGWFKVINYAGSGKPESKFSLKNTLDSINREIAILELKKEMIINKLKKGKYINK